MEPARPPPGPPGGERASALARIALGFTAFAERWVPDAFAFALCATVLVIVAGWPRAPRRP